MRDTTKEQEAIKKFLIGGGRPEQIAERVLQLQTADKFRIAAFLLEFGAIDVAEAVGMRACQEIQLTQLFGKSKR